MASAPEASRAWLLIEDPGPWPHEPAVSSPYLSQGPAPAVQPTKTRRTSFAVRRPGLRII